MTNRKKAGRGVRKPSHSTRASAGSASGSRKFYAVRGGRGGFSGVLNSWDECALQTTGVRGSAFKKFGTYDEALAFAQNKALDAPFTKQKKTKYYAVRYNGFNEIFTSWEECSLYVKGVSNASYKSFRTLEEATEFAHAKDDSAGGQPVSEFENSGTIAGIAGAVVGGSESKPAPNEHLVVFTDGACTNNGKPNSRAGYGVFFGEGSPLNISKPLPGRATNQRAEMMAVLMAIRTVLDHDLVVQGGILEIRTDSMYTKNGIDKWVDGWKKRDWKTANGADVKNRDLWVALDAAKDELLESGVNFHLVWVKGHAGHPGNEAADELAVAGIYEM